MLIADLERELFVRFPRRDAEAWDHVGLSVGDPEQEVRGVCCALDATGDAVRAAHGAGCNVLLTHHPVYLSAPASLTPQRGASASPSGAAVFEAIRLGVSVISHHTNLDRSMEVRRCLPELLGFEAASSLEHAELPDEPGLGAISKVQPIPLVRLAHRAADAFETDVQVWGDLDSDVRVIAFLGGSLGDLGERAVEARVDVVITGEAGYHRAQDLSQRGLSVILLGHDRSEWPFCRILADAAADAGVAREHIHIIPLQRQWRTISQGGIS